MKILPVAKSINTRIIDKANRIKNASSDGYKIADRTASVFKQNSVMRSLNIARSVGDKLVKTVTLNDLPYFAGAIGLFLPIPFTSPIMFVLGYIAKYTIPKAANMYNAAVSCYNNFLGK